MSLGHAYKTWLDFGDLGLIFKSTGGFLLEILLKMRYLVSYLFVCRLTFIENNPKSLLCFGGLNLIIEVKSQLTNVKYFPKIEVFL